MPDLVRVKDKSTGHEFSAPQEAVEANPEAYTVLKKDATDRAGRPLPPVHKAESKAVDTTKEGR